MGFEIWVIHICMCIYIYIYKHVYIYFIFVFGSMRSYEVLCFKCAVLRCQFFNPGRLQRSRERCGCLKPKQLSSKSWKNGKTAVPGTCGSFSFYAVRLRLSHKDNVTYCDQGVHFQPSLDYSKHPVNTIFFKAVSNVGYGQHLCYAPMCFEAIPVTVLTQYFVAFS